VGRIVEEKVTLETPIAIIALYNSIEDAEQVKMWNVESGLCQGKKGQILLYKCKGSEKWKQNVVNSEGHSVVHVY
jgi:hypothetical protein